jgi:hypothetical protein
MRFKLGFIEVESYRVDILPVEIGRFKGSLFSMMEFEGSIYYDFFYLVGVQAYRKT